MQPDKVPAVVREKNPPFTRRERQHFVVGGSFVPETAIDDAIEIMAELRECFANLGVEILVAKNRPIVQAVSLSAMALSISSRCAA